MKIICWLSDHIRNKPSVVYLHLIFAPYSQNLTFRSLFILNEWWDISWVCKTCPAGIFFHAVFSFVPQSHWIQFLYLFSFTLYFFGLDFIQNLIFTIKLIAMKKSSLLHLILLDLSLGFLWILIFVHTHTNGKSPFVQGLPLMSEINDYNGAQP